MSPAEERAIREGLPIVRLLAHDALAVLEGRAMMVGLADGTECLVRLYTAEEWLPLQHAVADKHGAPRVSMARAVELTRPLNLGRPS